MSDETLIQFDVSTCADVTSEKPESKDGSHDEVLSAPEGSAEEGRVCPRCDSHFGPEAGFCPFDGQRLVPRVGDPPSAGLIGRLISGRYRVLRLLGEGGMGLVYEVEHQTLRRRMALKMLRPKLAADPELSARFLREARAAAAIEHPNVVRITDFGVTREGPAYFVMELLEGCPLRSLVRRGPLAPDRVAHIARQVADGLAAAHMAGVIHRDLKPDNVHVHEAGGDAVKVLDFGLARVAGTSKLTQRGVVFGTPQYMSPEQASGGELDPRSDLYALGVILYELLTGRVPFVADSYMGVLTQHMYKRPQPPREIVGDADLGGLEPIVLRCLEKSPRKRYSNMVGLMAALDRRRSDRPLLEQSGRGVFPSVPTAPEGVDDESLRVPGLEVRRRWMFPLVLGVGVSGAGVGAWFARDDASTGEAPRSVPKTARAPSAAAPAKPSQMEPVPAGGSPDVAARPAASAAAPRPGRASRSEPPAIPRPASGARSSSGESAAESAAPRSGHRSPAIGETEIVDPWAD